MPNKEQVYDEQIYPLMDKIIEIAEKHNIPMVAVFQLNTDTLHVTTIKLAAANCLMKGIGCMLDSCRTEEDTNAKA